MGFLGRLLASSRYIVLVAIFGTFLASLALLAYEALVVLGAVAETVREGSVSRSQRRTSTSPASVSW